MTDTTKLPEALRIAGILRVTGPRHMTSKWIGEAFLELERQHDRIAELEAQLEAVGAGGVGAMMAKPVAARWYILNKLGMATLCASQSDAEQIAKDSDLMWPPSMGPHRAVQLVDASQALQPPIGCIVVQDADVVPHVHPDYGPGLFFTEDAVITSPQPPRLALDRREPVVWIDFHADPTLRPLVSIGAKPPPLWPDAEPLYRAIVELPPPLQIAEPAGHIYAECRECQSCGHIGINDASDSLAACTNCDWSGDSPKEDHCPGCESDGTMTAACPKCGARYNLLADAELPVTPKEPS